MSLDEVIVKRNQGVNTTTEKVEYSETGVKVIRANNISTGIVDYSNCVYVAEKTFERIKDACKPQKGDILYTNIGSQLGNAALVNTDENFVIAWNVLRLQPSNKINADFLVYLLNNPSNKKMIQSLNSSSTMPFVSGGEIGKVEFSFPDLNKQAEIAKILKSLDDKIHLNNQINQTLESIAQAIFKSWFIDFEPVRAKIAAKQEGKDPERAAMCVISGKSEVELHQMAEDDFAELQATAALFPDEFVESELGEVPKGWTLTLLKDVTTELRRGISPKYTEEPNGAIVINQKCIRNHTINFSLARKHDSSKRKIDGRELQIGDVLVNSTGVGTLGRIASVRYLDSITVVDSHVTVVRANDKKVSRAYLQGLLLENEKFIEASGAGTTGQTELRKEVLQDIKFPNPAVALHQQFDSIIYKINQEIANLEKMNISLSHVRNTLLPKLLSGELDMLLLRQEGA